MIPTADIRMSSMMRALSGVIIPALEHDANARDQAQMVLGHLNALRVQYDWLEEFERLELLHTRQLAGRLLSTAEDDYHDSEEVRALDRRASQPIPDAIAGCRAAQGELTEAIAEFVALQGKRGSHEAIRQSNLVVAEAEYKQSLRDRSVFSAFGYEADDPEVLPLETMMNEFRDDVSKERVTQ